MISAWAPGKLILSGEHAVVYGYRAIAIAVSRGTTVTLRPRPGPSAIEASVIDDARLWPALSTVIPAEGFGVSIASDLPIGCGMGSSAALAVATVRAVARAEGREADFAEIYERAFVIERVFHGTPSGIDHTVSAMGGAVLYRKGEAPVALALGAPLRLVVANTGTPGNTAEMVAGVRARNPERELRRIGAITEMVSAHLQRGEDVGALLDENHRMLQAIGVSTPRLDAVCAAMRSAGATGAKLAGAGGGGVAIAVGGDPAALIAAAVSLGCEAFEVRSP